MWNIVAMLAAIVGRCAIDLIFGGCDSSSPSDPSERTQDVSGYRRRDGTCVRSYYRRPPR
jgi:hypothetical protein